MKINAVTPFRNTCVSRNNLKNNANYSMSPSFEGIFDVFKKQPVQKTVKQQESDDINDILKSAINGDKGLKYAGKTFLKHLNILLKKGKEQDYKGHLYFTDKKLGKNLVTFGDIDNELQMPTNVNVWQNGKLKSVYEIECYTPQSIFTVTTYADNRESFFRFINDKCLCFQSLDNNDMFSMWYPAENGFCQQQSKKVNDKDALLYYELYWDYKNPENSYFLQNTNTDAIRYGYDKKQKFWYEKEIIPYETKGETQTFTSEE